MVHADSARAAIFDSAGPQFDTLTEIPVIGQRGRPLIDNVIEARNFRPGGIEALEVFLPRSPRAVEEFV